VESIPRLTDQNPLKWVALRFLTPELKSGTRFNGFSLVSPEIDFRADVASNPDLDSDPFRVSAQL
jgi:hypothetical protein